MELTLLYSSYQTGTWARARAWSYRLRSKHKSFAASSNSREPARPADRTAQIWLPRLDSEFTLLEKSSLLISVLFARKLILILDQEDRASMGMLLIHSLSLSIKWHILISLLRLFVHAQKHHQTLRKWPSSMHWIDRIYQSLVVCW